MTHFICAQEYLISPIARLKTSLLLAPLLTGFVLGVASQLQQAALFKWPVYAVLTGLTLMGLLLLLWLTKRHWFSLGLVLTLSAMLGFGLVLAIAKVFALRYHTGHIS